MLKECISCIFYIRLNVQQNVSVKSEKLYFKKEFSLLAYSLCFNGN